MENGQLDINTMYQRQHDLLPIHKINQTKISIFGIGHVGSTVAFMLAKSGAFTNPENPGTLVDFDTVEEANMGGVLQFYRKTDIGRPKVEALKDNLEMFSDCHLNIVNGKYETGKYDLSGIVVCGVDKMEYRKQIFEDCVKSGNTDLFIDTRTGGFVTVSFAIRPKNKVDVEFYRESLFSDADAAPVPCTARGLSYTTMRAADMAGENIGMFLLGEKQPIAKRVCDLRNGLILVTKLQDEATGLTIKRKALGTAEIE